MSVRMFAAKIPHNVRTEMLKIDLINAATLNSADPKMNLLLDIWHDYIEPHKEKSHCVYCMQNIISNFKAMLPELVELENKFLKFKDL